nr:MAG TPA: hypothetical protein [Caudoviricetes sp.]
MRAKQYDSGKGGGEEFGFQKRSGRPWKKE